MDSQDKNKKADSQDIDFFEMINEIASAVFLPYPQMINKDINKSNLIKKKTAVFLKIN